MKTLTRMIILIALVGGATAVTPAAPATARAYDDLTVSSVAEYGYTYTDFSTPVGYGEHSSVSGALVNAATKAPVAGFFPPRKGDRGKTRMQGTLAAGNYTLTLTDTTLGHWSCSVYNPDGCSWVDEWSTTYVWKFHWPGGGTITVPRTTPLPEVKGRARFQRLNQTTCRVKGYVASRIENADFSMGPWTRHKRTVKVQYKHAGFWYTEAKGKSKANGKFDLRFGCKKRQRWGVLIPAERGLPEAWVAFGRKKH